MVAIIVLVFTVTHLLVSLSQAAALHSHCRGAISGLTSLAYLANAVLRPRHLALEPFIDAIYTLGIMAGLALSLVSGIEKVFEGLARLKCALLGESLYRFIRASEGRASSWADYGRVILAVAQICWDIYTTLDQFTPLRILIASLLIYRIYNLLTATIMSRPAPTNHWNRVLVAIAIAMDAALFPNGITIIKVMHALREVENLILAERARIPVV